MNYYEHYLGQALSWFGVALLACVLLAVAIAPPTPVAMTSAEIGVQFPQLSDERCQQIADGYVWLGMTDEMARASWGTPSSVNSSVGSWGRHEQWVYRHGEYGSANYLYFENGYLASWQI